MLTSVLDLVALVVEVILLGEHQGSSLNRIHRKYSAINLEFGGILVVKFGRILAEMTAIKSGGILADMTAVKFGGISVVINLAEFWRK